MIFRLLLFLTLLVACGVVLLLGLMFFSVSKELPQLPEKLEQITQAPPTEIYAADGSVIAVLGGRQYVPLSRISPYFQNAVIAAEDKNFWKHHGLDKVALLRAAYRNIKHRRITQGGSTITQQLAKTMFFTLKRDWKRKIKDMLMALQIEKRFTKEEILEAYCNQSYFGGRAFGIESAAQTFFSKHADRLTLAEASLLAGLPNSPSRNNPYVNLRAAKTRQKTILERMANLDMITQPEADAAFQDSLVLQPMYQAVLGGSYFVDYVLRQLEEDLGRDIVYYGGLKIFTTMIPRYQEAAEDAVTQGLKELDALTGDDTRFDLSPEDRLQAALVCIDPGSGSVLAIVGGRNYRESEFNRAVYAARLPGSSFKPFVYLAALEKGFTPKSVLVDEAVSFDIPGSRDWTPDNFDDFHRGPLVLKKALALSINVIAAQLIDKVGPGLVVETARKLGIRSPLAANLSLALGTSPVTTMDMASAFATMANEGTYYPPIAVTRIEDRHGTVLREHFFSGTREYNPETIYPLVDMMKEVVDRGTASGIRRLGFSAPAAGKTGTTNDYKDAWFTGYTPNLSTSVWVGYDQKRELKDKNHRGITGGRGGAPIWAKYMMKITSDQPPRDFAIPAGIRFQTVDVATGRPPTESTADTIRVALTFEGGKRR
jgi:penicillin-binding protein 1A